MSANDPADWGFLAAVLAMGVATYLLRAGGFWLMGHVPLTAHLRRMLEALPGSIVTATVLPIALKGGPAAMLGVAAAVAVMIVRRSELLAVLAGMAAAALVRLAGFG